MMVYEHGLMLAKPSIAVSSSRMALTIDYGDHLLKPANSSSLCLYKYAKVLGRCEVGTAPVERAQPT